jgi:hypothetical protein
MIQEQRVSACDGVHLITHCRAQQQAIEEYWAGEPDDAEGQRIGAMIGWLDWEAEARILREEGEA